MASRPLLTETCLFSPSSYSTFLRTVLRPNPCLRPRSLSKPPSTFSIFPVGRYVRCGFLVVPPSGTGRLRVSVLFRLPRRRTKWGDPSGLKFWFYLNPLGLPSFLSLFVCSPRSRIQKRVGCQVRTRFDGRWGQEYTVTWKGTSWRRDMNHGMPISRVDTIETRGRSDFRTSTPVE